MYKSASDNKGVIRLRDQAYIPDDPGNADRQKYQLWLEDGNTPEPADPEPEPSPPEPTVREVIAAIDARDKGIATQWDDLLARIK